MFARDGIRKVLSSIRFVHSHRFHAVFVFEISYILVSLLERMFLFHEFININ
jgi:hypothetical protein